jgi:hypothetical protein
MADHADALARYLKRRDVCLQINHALLKVLDKEATQEAGLRLGILQRGILVFDSESEMPILFDYAIHFYRTHGRNAVDTYLEKTPPPEGSPEMLYLQALRRSHYSFLRVDGSEPGRGLAVQDMLRDEPGFLVDVALSKTAWKGMIIATRVVPWEDYLTTSGAALPVTVPVMKDVQKALERTFDSGSLDLQRLTPDQEAELAAVTISACLKRGVSSRVGYTESVEGHPGRPAAIRSPSAIRSPEAQRSRRNAPCPCGSGKKYKSCCGRR